MSHPSISCYCMAGTVGGQAAPPGLRVIPCIEREWKLCLQQRRGYIPFAPHNPSGPVANAATLQLAATCPNFEILEIMYSDVEWRKDVTNESLEYKDGYITIPDKPGLGIEINEEECLKHPYQVHTLRHYTGALTDIRPAKTEFYF